MDKAYVDFKRLYNIDGSLAYFVTRAKDNFSFTRVRSVKPEKSKGVMCDQTVRLKGKKSNKAYPKYIRRSKYYDTEQQRYFVFITNNFDQCATDIALLYKYRWKVELFFKWIKQHLKIKSFWGTSFNAVKTQVYIAITTYTLVAIIKSTLKLKQSNYEILQILSISLLDKTSLNELLGSTIYQEVKELQCEQLKMALI